MSTYLITIGLIFALMLAGIAVNLLYRRFAARNPQLGPFRKNDGSCGCCAGKCGDSQGCSTQA